MPPRRVQHSNTSSNLSLSPESSGPPGVRPSPSLPSFTRSASPSGISNFFSRPTKWFARTASATKPSPTEPRSSTSSVASSSRRRPTISGPSDPRPIEGSGSGPVNGSQIGGGLAALSEKGSRCVVFSTLQPELDKLKIRAFRSSGRFWTFRVQASISTLRQTLAVWETCVLSRRKHGLDLLTIWLLRLTRSYLRLTLPRWRLGLNSIAQGHQGRLLSPRINKRRIPFPPCLSPLQRLRRDQLSINSDTLIRLQAPRSHQVPLSLRQTPTLRHRVRSNHIPHASVPLM